MINGFIRKTPCFKKIYTPHAGKGLFTKVSIHKGKIIVEYKGKVTTWKDVNEDKGRNRYIYYINRNIVIDARDDKKGLARYANDSKQF